MNYTNTLSTIGYNVTGTTGAFASDQRGFWNLLQLIIICFGTVANISMLVLIVKEKAKKTSYTVYVGAIVVNDIIYLIITFLYFSLFVFFDIDIITTSAFVCKSLPFILNASWALHGWLLLTLTTERLFHAYFLRMTKLFERRNSGVVAVCLIVGVAAFFNLHYVLHVDLFESLSVDAAPNRIVCHIVYQYFGDQFQEYFRLYNRFVYPVFTGCLPGVFILAGNVLLMKALCQSLRAPVSTRRFSVKDGDKYVFTILVSLMFLCIDMPLMMMHFERDGTSFDDGIHALMLLNHSLKYLIYIIYKQTVRLRCIRCKADRQTDKN